MNTKHISSNGQFASKRASKHSGIRLFYFLFGVIGIIVVSGTYLGKTTSMEVKKVSKSVASAVVHTAKAERSPDRLDKAVLALKREVVDHLRKDEGGGHVIAEGEIFGTFDPTDSMNAKCKKVGGKMPSECMSYGLYQAKLETIKMWNKQLNGVSMTDMEALTLALDTEKMTEFVTRVVFEIKGSCFAWTACRNEKTWYNERIDMIRKLETI